MKNKVVLFFALNLVMINAMAQVGQKIVSSKIEFSIQNAGLTVLGNFSGLSGDFGFNPEKFAASFVSLSIPANSIKTGISMRDSHLKKQEYFNVTMFPDIKLKSKFFGKQGKEFKGYFALTLKGVTKDISFPFTVKVENGRRIYEGSFVLNRLDYGIGGKSLVMGNEVIVKFNIVVEE